MMTQVMGCCGKYVQGYGVLHDLNKYVDWMGSKFLVVASKKPDARPEGHHIRRARGKRSLLL